MLLFTTVSAFLFVRPSIAGYVMADDYTPSSFFDMFSFFTSSDPTHGFVDYIAESDAQSSGLIKTNSDSVYIGVDYTNQAPNGRASVRLTSNKAYSAGSLVVLDLGHMPGGICGTWPAFWMVGPDWPYGGEIDIIEGVNEQSTNDMTLHTGPGCSISDNGAFSGNILTSNCDVNAAGQSTNAGCQIDTTNTATYGTQFNANGGGVYAMEWTSSAISIYFFQRGSIPSDVSSGSPNPSGWGKPLAQFQGGCDIDSMFQNQSIVFDTTFCGDWAGNTWSSSSCASKASTCDDFVANNPSAFQEAYWIVNSLKVYQQSDSVSSSVSIPSYTTTSAVYAGISTASSTVVESSSNVDSQSVYNTASSSSNNNNYPSSYVSSTNVVTPTNTASSQSQQPTSVVSTSVYSQSSSPVVSSNNAQSTSNQSSSQDDGQDGLHVGKDGSVYFDNQDDSSNTVSQASNGQDINSNTVHQASNGQVNVGANKAHLSPTVTISIDQDSTVTGAPMSITAVTMASATTLSLATTTIDIPMNAVVVGNMVMEVTEPVVKRRAEDSARVAERDSSAEAKISRHWHSRLQEEKAKRVRHVGSHRRGGLWMH